MVTDIQLVFNVEESINLSDITATVSNQLNSGLDILSELSRKTVHIATAVRYDNGTRISEVKLKFPPTDVSDKAIDAISNAVKSMGGVISEISRATA